MNDNIFIFPTDTVYGIGCRLYDSEAIKSIYEIKGRDFNKPISVLCSSINQIEEFAEVTIEARLIGKKFWPGGLTLILNTKEGYYKKTNEKTIGVRIPNHKFALKLIDELGPLKTTSINRSGEEPLNDFDVIKAVYGNKITNIYENSEEISRVSSTVVDLTNGVNVLRTGDISLNDILNILE